MFHSYSSMNFIAMISFFIRICSMSNFMSFLKFASLSSSVFSNSLCCWMSISFFNSVRYFLLSFSSSAFLGFLCWPFLHL